MLLTNYKLEMVWVSGCCMGWQSAVAELSEDIDKVLPRLEPALEGSIYEPNQKVLRLAKGETEISIYPKKIVADFIKDEGEGRALVEWLKGVINETYESLRSSPTT